MLKKISQSYIQRSQQEALQVPNSLIVNHTVRSSSETKAFLSENRRDIWTQRSLQSLKGFCVESEIDYEVEDQF